MKVLIADDSATMRLMLNMMLVEHGYEVISAQNGREAWDALEKGDIQLAILDWMMPELDGVEICEKIQERNSSTWVYILLLTSRSNDNHITTALESGASDYISKPFQESELLSRLKVGERIIKLQTQLGHVQKMRSLGQLANGIAHEINTPIQFISDNLQFLKNSFRDIINHSRILQMKMNNWADNSEFQESLEYLSDEIPEAIDDSLAGIHRVTDIVTAMKIFSQTGNTEKVFADINKIIQDTITMSSNEWKCVACLHTDFDNTLPHIPCFPNEFSQVILNLLLNSVLAIRDRISDNPDNKGAICLSSRLLGDWIEIKVNDNGIGISGEVADKIFDPFFTTRDVGQGTGQGLTIVHDIVTDRHGGNISFVSNRETGTTFTVKLPVR